MIIPTFFISWKAKILLPITYEIRYYIPNEFNDNFIIHFHNFTTNSALANTQHALHGLLLHVCYIFRCHINTLDKRVLSIRHRTFWYLCSFWVSDICYLPPVVVKQTERQTKKEHLKSILYSYCYFNRTVSIQIFPTVKTKGINHNWLCMNIKDRSVTDKVCSN